MTESDLIVKGYVVGRQDDALLLEVAAETDTSKSATLRRIIREWNDWRQRRMVDSPGEYITATIGDDRV